MGDLAFRADADGADFVLTGVKSPVEAGAEADQLLVTATTDAGPTQFLLATDTPGLTVTPLRSVDLVRRYARVEFEGVRLPAGAVVGEVGNAAADVETQLQIAGVVQSAEMVGAAEVVFDFTLDWAFSRYSFGRPLASYQEIKHRFADMKMWLEASHGLADLRGAPTRNVTTTRRWRPVPPRPTPATTWPSSCRTACRCTVASASPTSTTSTSSCGASPSTGSPTAPPPTTASGSPPSARTRPDPQIDEASHMSTSTTTTNAIESVEEFRLRARTWLAENFPRSEGVERPLPRRGE